MLDPMLGKQHAILRWRRSLVALRSEEPGVDRAVRSPRHLIVKHPIIYANPAVVFYAVFKFDLEHLVAHSYLFIFQHPVTLKQNHLLPHTFPHLLKALLIFHLHAYHNVQMPRILLPQNHHENLIPNSNEKNHLNLVQDNAKVDSKT
ncbi:uncharacterized protein N0V89_010278 [Didymosphaeria variabile]|uniref:Uncharacterized protein n=1 Tax=Didymosphaeria variabile TaxID=1932322 RepID=A0A9W8XCG2_9PLEO|nr:uncharacterized protein N0V89_010278 [Didymosphaeria variabile]KAJ4346349.1 hypothetical protein N0V89_010278 [Didymosphaeria variabile]